MSVRIYLVMQTRIHIVYGPTASGKSARALDIAQREHGVIINADAMQVYRELSVLTARPKPEEEARVPHKLYGVFLASEPCSVARWLALAKDAIEQVLAENKLPVVVGGTGLYLKALMEGLSAIPDVPAAAHEEATRLYAEKGEHALQECDPELAGRLNAGDTQRHIRGLGVWLATGKSLCYWQQKERIPPFPEALFTGETIAIERQELYRRCDQRFLGMLEQGAIEEVRNLLSLGLSGELPAMRAVGVPELAGYLQGELTLEEAVQRAQQATRNYAKRQLTWFRHQMPVQMGDNVSE